MSALCVVPFTAILAAMGVFDSALSWLTKGEVGRLNYGQRRKLRIMAFVSTAIWACAIAVIITLVVVRKKHD